MSDKIVNGLPIYSTVRFVLDFTEGKLKPIFNHALAMPSKTNLQAFTYGIGDGMGPAGFHPTALATSKHTNMQRKGEVPNRGKARIHAVGLIPDGFLLKPDAVTNQTTVCGIGQGSHYHTPDLVGVAGLAPGADTTASAHSVAADTVAGQIYTHALRLISAAYTPYLQKGDTGPKTYFASASLMAPGRAIADGRVGVFGGAPFALDEGIVWDESGDSANVILGFELVNDRYNAPWDISGASAATDPTQTIRRALGYAAAGSEPASPGVVLAVLDVTCAFYAVRESSANV